MAKESVGNPDAEELALQIMALFGGAGAVAALPLLVALTEGRAPQQVLALVFAFPLAMIAIGRLDDRPWAQRVGAIAAGLLAATLLFSRAIAGTLAGTILSTAVPGILALGALVAMVLVGRYALEQDRLGGGVWLIATSIALIGGFLGLGAGAGGVVGAIGGVLLLGCAVALQRLRVQARQRRERR